MSHGEDPYRAILFSSGALLSSFSLFFPDSALSKLLLDSTPDCNPEVCNTTDEQASYNSARAHMQTAFVGFTKVSRSA